jgi:hypothetical protein
MEISHGEEESQEESCEEEVSHPDLLNFKA